MFHCPRDFVLRPLTIGFRTQIHPAASCFSTLYTHTLTALTLTQILFDRKNMINQHDVSDSLIKIVKSFEISILMSQQQNVNGQNDTRTANRYEYTVSRLSARDVILRLQR